MTIIFLHEFGKKCERLSRVTQYEALVFDAREYQGNLGDGMVTPDNIDNFIMDNFSGRYNNKSFDHENLVEELKKYDSTYSNFFRNHIKTNFNVKDLIDKYLESINIPKYKFNIN